MFLSNRVSFFDSVNEEFSYLATRSERALFGRICGSIIVSNFLGSYTKTIRNPFWIKISEDLWRDILYEIDAVLQQNSSEVFDGPHSSSSETNCSLSHISLIVIQCPLNLYSGQSIYDLKRNISSFSVVQASVF